MIAKIRSGKLRKNLFLRFCLSFAYTPIPLYPYAPYTEGKVRRRREPTFGSGEGVIAEGEGVRGDRRREPQAKG